MIALNLEVRDALVNLKRANIQYDLILDKAFNVEDLIENKINMDLRLKKVKF